MRKIKKNKISVVVPCYKVTNYILDVIKKIEKYIWKIYIVDDCCPENTGEYVKTHCKDKRVKVIKNEKNLGVGGAVMCGYVEAINDGADIIVKIDGDGQMDPHLISKFVIPIIEGRADYTKGNRFFNIEGVRKMPKVRIFGNAVLSFMAKLSTGYWSIFDPTNGYTAIHAKVAALLPFDKISKSYFFETDMLFRLYTLHAKVVDIPMDAVYEGEESNLKIRKILGEFLFKHCKNLFKRIFYNYFLRDLSVASFELISGLLFFVFGVSNGVYNWINSAYLNVLASAGTVMLSALPIIIGIQFLLNFLAYDISSQPHEVIHREI